MGIESGGISRNGLEIINWRREFGGLGTDTPQGEERGCSKC